MDEQQWADAEQRFQERRPVKLSKPKPPAIDQAELAASVITNELANGALKDWSMSRCAEVAADIVGALDAADVGVAALRAEVEQLTAHVRKLQNAIAALVTVVPGAKSGLEPEG